MRATAAICVLLGLVFAVEASADTRKTTTAVTVRKQPGEKQAAVTKLAPGTTVEVVGEDGRWLKIRVKRVEGYVTRTTVTAAEPPPAAKPVWSAPRRPDGKPVTALYVQVVAPTATLRAAPKDAATTVTELALGGRLVVIDAAAEPGWIHARDDQGHDGWIARAQVDDGASAVAVTAADLRGSDPRDVEYDRAPRKPLAIRAEVGIGFRSLGMDLSTNAEGGLSNYIVDADAVALTVGATTTVRMSGPWFVAADARLQLSNASPGIDYLGPTSPAGRIPFRTYEAELGARAGVHAKRAFELALRAAGHYDAFITNSVDNPGMLPRERLVGLTLGAVADVVPPHSPFSATMKVDVLALGARAQTPGLEDGTSNTARAVWGGLTVRYLVGRRWTLFGAYEFGRATTTWSGMSTRHPGVTNARRVDTSQLLQVGLGAEL